MHLHICWCPVLLASWAAQRIKYAEHFVFALVMMVLWCLFPFLSCSVTGGVQEAAVRRSQSEG
jgi:hypothetical protein